MSKVSEFNIDREMEYQDKLKSYPERWHYIFINNERTNYKISNHGRLSNVVSKTITDFSYMRSPYYRTELHHDGKRYSISVHRTVATYFCEIPKRYIERNISYDQLVPNHKDGDKHHNAAFNLEWVTPKENTDHAWKVGLCDNIRGEKSHLSKITEEDAIQICEYIMQKKRNIEISKLMPHVSEKTIQHIRSGECWKHIASRYKFPKLDPVVKCTVPSSKIHEVCKLLSEKKYTDVAISELTGVNRRYIGDIRRRKYRTDISSQYTF